MPHRAWVVALAVCGLLEARAGAQTDALFSRDVRDPIVVVEVKQDAATTESDVCPCHPWSVDFLLGFPTGIRVKRLLNNDSNCGLMVEAFAGIEVILPTAGAGFRYAFAPWEGHRDVISISPGVDVYGLQSISTTNSVLFDRSSRSIGLIGGDVDISWRHAYTNQLSGELGLKIGVATEFSHDGVVIPIISLFAAFRFWINRMRRAHLRHG